MGVRTQELRPSLAPAADSKYVGRKPLRNTGKLDLNQVIADPNQPRMDFSEEALEHLAQSIQDKGQLQAIRVRWSGELDKWVIIAGERRFRATKRAGLTEIDCVFTVTITGLGAEQTIIDARGTSGVFFISQNAGDVTLAGMTITGGISSGDGGGISSESGGQLTITAMNIIDNSAAFGGGIWARSDITVTNSTIASNSAGFDGGGGIWADGNVTVTNSTIAGNSAEFNGGGIWAGSSIHLTSSIVAVNTAQTDPDLTKTPATLFQSLVGNSAGTSLVQAQTPDANGNLIGAPENPIDPLLAPLANNGGPTLTHALLAGSPAIDAGSNPDGFLFDQRGEPFVRELNGQADMGAFEGFLLVEHFFLVVTTAEDELDEIFNSEDLSLREAIAMSNTNPGADTIAFDDQFTQTEFRLQLTLGELEVRDTVTIIGLGAAQTIIDAQENSRIFEPHLWITYAARTESHWR